MGTTNRSIFELGPDVCAEPALAIEREWLVTNGIGGYAFGTISGIATRSYHGLLVAALAPPVGRTVLVDGLEEWITVGATRPPASHVPTEDAWSSTH